MSVGEIINITDLLGGRVRIKEESIQGVLMNNSIFKCFKSSLDVGSSTQSVVYNGEDV